MADDARSTSAVMTALSTQLPVSAAAAGIVGDVRAAISSRTPIRIVGSGTWENGGAPVRAERRVTLAPHAAIVEYVPGDLTLTALAGTTLEELRSVTAANAQWLPLDPFGPTSGTIGGVVATGSWGPLAHAHGTPRDQVLGVEAVTGRGEIVRGGGRVTKNVAGFDLTRLLIGSWGTLGIVTEVTVRLRARPQDEVTLAIAMPSEPLHLAQQLRALRTAPLEALAMELLDSSLSTSLGLGTAATILVRLGGNPERVAAQTATLVAMGDPVAVDPHLWTTLREIDSKNAWVWRMSDLPSRIGETWTHAQRVGLAAGRCWMHATLTRGVVRCIAFPREENAAIRSQTSDLLSAALSDPAFRGTLIVEQLPADRWPLHARSNFGDPVSVRLRRAFDPHRLLNPGIFGEDAA
jgi:glycolate oxidase FAD binding subunit